MTRENPIALVSGILFGAGLSIGGMADPARVRGFLDVFGNWDPTLAFVMGGAVIVMAAAWRFVPGMSSPLFSGEFHLPGKSDLTPKLVGGSALFGLGWGIAGLCPGPGFVALVIEPGLAVIFIVTFILGMLIPRLLSGGQEA